MADSAVATRRGRRLAVALALVSVAWGGSVVREVAWRAVAFYPEDLARQVWRHHRRYDAGVERGLAAAGGEPGEALAAQLERCVRALRTPVPLADLVEELGVLATRTCAANDPLAVSDGDPMEPRYAAAWEAYVISALPRLRLVYYGPSELLLEREDPRAFVAAVLARSRRLYPYVGQELVRDGRVRDWRTVDDRSVAFGTAGVALSHALTDLANLATYVWVRGGGLPPTPRPTPRGHVGPTVTVTLGGGFPERERPGRGAPAMPPARLRLPTPGPR